MPNESTVQRRIEGAASGSLGRWKMFNWPKFNNIPIPDQAADTPALAVDDVAMACYRAVILAKSLLQNCWGSGCMFLFPGLLFVATHRPGTLSS